MLPHHCPGIVIPPSKEPMTRCATASRNMTQERGRLGQPPFINNYSKRRDHPAGHHRNVLEKVLVSGLGRNISGSWPASLPCPPSLGTGQQVKQPDQDERRDSLERTGCWH